MEIKDIVSLIQKLGYKEKSKDIFEKKYARDYVISINAKKGTIDYGSEIKRGDLTTSNFEHDENFVVLECVNRLLTKGYRPEDLHLEKRWKVGRGVSGGKADICISKDIDGENKTFLIVECKTWGDEYENEKKKTVSNGGQVFSYFQQETSTQYLCIYASRLNEHDEIEYVNSIIKTVDDEELIEQAKEDEHVKLFSKATNNKGLYEVWKENSACYFHPNGIFDKDVQAYEVDLKPLKKKDLVEFKDDNYGFFHNQFAEILRHNNISDKENAFNKLISLFIAKMVDEQKSDDEILDFQYKEGVDDYFALQDRLQKLYKDGMELYLREDIFYVEEDYVDKTFSKYDNKRDRLRMDLIETIRKLKFYSNNEFAFKEVYNEELFNQNAKVLVEVVKLLQPFQLLYSKKHQMLGNLFELLLNDGFKQSEGQYFTPIPIATFIWHSLPVEKMMENKNNNIPRVIDYSCGSGHFLTEGIDTIIRRNEELKYSNYDSENYWVKDAIYGIEKDNRLARVSKIALFLNGAGNANIIFGDGLEHDKERLGEYETFDILVANPPYSVKAFKQYLRLKYNTFSIIDTISDSSGEIETLFIERINQLVKPTGVAAVILPSTVLTKADSKAYIAARETIIRNFNIKAIVELPGGTFIATDSTTVVLFLEKFDRPPKLEDFYMDTVDNIFEKNIIERECGDDERFGAYLSKIGVAKDVYIRFLNGDDYNDFSEIPYFAMYIEQFNSLSKVKNLIKSPSFVRLSGESKKQKLNLEFYKYVLPIEKEKVYYFSLMFGQMTLVIKGPKAKKEVKEFLGFYWSKRKGDEGLKKQGVGKLVNMEDINDKTKLAYAVHEAFKGHYDVDSDLEKYTQYVQLVDMVEFKKVEFNKIINTKSQKYFQQYEKIFLKNKQPQLLFNKVATLEYGKSLPEIERRNGDVIVVGSNGDIGRHDEALISGPAIIVGRKGSAGKVNYIEKDCYPIDTTYYVKLVDDNVSLEYLYYLLKQMNLEDLAEGIGAPGLNREMVYSIKIPVPDETVQKEIIKACKENDDNILNLENENNILSKQLFDLMEKEIVGYTKDKEQLGIAADLVRGPFGGSLKKSMFVSKGYKVYEQKNAINADLTLGEYFITKEKYEEMQRFAVKEGDILVSCSGTIGKTVIIPKDYEEGIINQALLKITPSTEFRSEFIRYILMSSIMGNTYEGHGTGINNIEKNDLLKEISIPKPSLSEQDIIIAKLKEIEAKIETNKKKIEQGKKSMLKDFTERLKG